MTVFIDTMLRTSTVKVLLNKKPRSAVTVYFLTNFEDR